MTIHRRAWVRSISAAVLSLVLVPALAIEPALRFDATKVCQVTGVEDREHPDQLTGFRRSGITGGVTGTDLGFPFEYDGKLVMLFGDSREFDPDRCEPAWCGTEVAPKPAKDPEGRLTRWHTPADWDAWTGQRLEGSDSIATAPLAFDPEQCVPASVETDEHGSVYVQEIASEAIGASKRLSGSAVAAQANDKWVNVVNGRILVTTATGATFAQELTSDNIGTAFQLSGPPVATRPEDKWVVAMGDRLLVGTSAGRVFAHRVTSLSVEAAVKLGGPKVASRPEDRWVLAAGDRLLVVTRDGRVFAHPIVGDVVGEPFQLEGPPVASGPRDKWVLFMDDRLLVITTDGRLFVHPVDNNVVGKPFQLGGPEVAGKPQDQRVLAADHRLLVLSGQDGRFRPTQLDSRPVGRKEGAIGAVVDGGAIHAFFTLKNGDFAHDDVHPGGRTVLATSSDGARSFTKVAEISTTKFLWAVPEVEAAGSIPGLPAGMDSEVVMVWGAGRQDSQGRATLFHHSYPYLAVVPLASIGIRSAWRFYAGQNAHGRPVWLKDEARAQPVLPFGSAQFDSDPHRGPGYHQCLGYFTVRRIGAWGKWVMLYACNNDPKTGYNTNNGPRGIYLRTADRPWGPWSDPQLIFDPGRGYCHFMYNVSFCDCPQGAPNPAEESVRNTTETPTGREWGGEYAPILLPSRYAKKSPTSKSLYFFMATWNPYQVVLMRLDAKWTPVTRQTRRGAPAGTLKKQY